MYTVKCCNGSSEYILYDTEDEQVLLASAALSEGINKTGTFVFSIPSTNENFTNIHTLQSEIIVEDMDGAELYRGRPIEANPDMYNTTEYTCEGILAYLLDTKYPPYLHSSSPELFLRTLLDYHNQRVTDKQKIYPGIVTVTVPESSSRFESDQYDSVLNIIQEKLVSAYGGMLRLRRSGNRNYLDYLADYPLSSQVARIGENVIDLTRCIKTDTVRTVIIPIGAQDKETGEFVDISSVNHGKNYLVDEELVTRYGWIEDVIEFEEETQPESLLEKGRQYLEQCRNFEMSIELSMVDCRLLGIDAERLYPGMQVMVETDFHKIHQYFLCTEKETDLLNPANDKIVLGSQMQTFTENVNKEQKNFDNKVETVGTSMKIEIKQTKDEFTDALNNASGLYKTDIVQPDQTIISYYHDKKDLNTSEIRMTFNSKGFAISGNGGESWYGMQVDGDMITGILNSTGINAEYIRAGIIRSKDFEAGKSGIEFNLDTGVITSYKTVSDHLHQKMEISKALVKITEIESGRNVVLDAQSIEVSTNDYFVGIEENAIQFAKKKGELLTAFMSLATQGITMYDNTDITFMENESYQKGKTGRAEFSDGSYLEFKKGVLVGGKTADGGEIS